MVTIPISQNNEPVANWMTTNVITIQSCTTVKESIDILDNHTIFGIPVVDEHNTYLGLMSKTVLMNHITSTTIFSRPVTDIMMTDSETISPNSTMDEAANLKDGCLPVIDHHNKLVGIITRTDIIKSNAHIINRAKQDIDTAETLQLVLNSAYEGVVVVNQEGYIQEINESYCELINLDKQSVLNKHCTKVIDNTRLHIVAKNGIAEKGRMQQINGVELIVHRIPIIKNKQATGAIGILVFKDISEMQTLYSRVNQLKNQQVNDSIQLNMSLTDKMIGTSPSMIAAKKLAMKVARIPSNIFISGESGTGKEVFAKTIHDMSQFAKGPFVCVNCSAIPENLLESELFGYEEGAFTDASRGGKMGKFEQAENGTIFLDEIGDMPLSMQAKLLRVLQERTIERVGGSETKHINLRVISATHRHLKQMVKEGTFREDLYYRINVINLHLPALRQRQEDIPLFLNHALEKFSLEFGFGVKQLDKEALAVLNTYSWPGNIRELFNVCESLVALVEDSLIQKSDLPPYILEAYTTNQSDLTLIEKQEKNMIIQLLATHNQNKSLVAKEMDMSRNTLYQKIKKYQL